MRTLIVAIVLTLAGCNNGYKQPELPKAPTVEDITGPICDAKDQPISKDTPRVTVQGQCKTHGLDIPLRIDPPNGLSKPVDRVNYRNYRTCVSGVVHVNSSKPFDQTHGPDEIPISLNVLHLDGALQVHLDDGDSKIDLMGIPVREGANLLEIQYVDADNTILGTERLVANVSVTSQSPPKAGRLCP